MSDIMLPPVALLPFMSRRLGDKFLVMRPGPHFADGYNTKKQAIEDGAIIMTYGYGGDSELPEMWSVLLTPF